MIIFFYFDIPVSIHSIGLEVYDVRLRVASYWFLLVRIINGSPIS